MRFKEFFSKRRCKVYCKTSKKKQHDLVWISYASQSYFLIKEIKKLDKNIKIVADMIQFILNLLKGNKICKFI